MDWHSQRRLSRRQNRLGAEATKNRLKGHKCIPALTFQGRSSQLLQITWLADSCALHSPCMSHDASTKFHHSIAGAFRYLIGAPLFNSHACTLIMMQYTISTSAPNSSTRKATDLLCLPSSLGKCFVGGPGNWACRMLPRPALLLHHGSNQLLPSVDPNLQKHRLPRRLPQRLLFVFSPHLFCPRGCHHPVSSS